MKMTEKVDILMKSRGIENKFELAKQSGIPYTTIVGLYEKGYENIKLSTLQKLSAFLGCTLDYLAYDEEENIKKPDVNLNDGLSKDDIDFFKFYQSLSKERKEAIRLILKQGK